MSVPTPKPCPLCRSPQVQYIKQNPESLCKCRHCGCTALYENWENREGDLEAELFQKVAGLYKSLAHLLTLMNGTERRILEKVENMDRARSESLVLELDAERETNQELSHYIELLEDQMGIR